LRLAKINRYNN